MPVKQRDLVLPSWWRHLNPRGTSKFWRAVEQERVKSGVSRWDYGGIQTIVKGVQDGRHH
jgi:hypothetical protein